MTNNSQYTIAEHASFVANAAAVAVEFGGMELDTALDFAANVVVQKGRDACKRAGTWARTTSSSEIEQAAFGAAVARDIINGSVCRPSTGNVRQYALAQLASILTESK